MIEEVATQDGSGLLSQSEAEVLEYKAQMCKDMYQEGCKFPPWTDSRAKWWVRSLKFFVEEFIHPPLSIPDFHNKWYWWCCREQTYMNLSPRDHAKTTIHSVYRTVWETCCDRNLCFFIAMGTLDVGKRVLLEIKGHLTQNQYILSGFGIFNPADLSQEERRVDLDWSQTTITVNRSNYAVKDPTVAVAGATTNVLSRRADRMLADDIVSMRTAYSEQESRSLKRWYFSDVQPILKPDGQEIITGTRRRRGDFYHHVEEMSIENGGVYRVFVGDAILDEKKKKVLWPERWSYANLMKRRAQVGVVNFNLNYRNRVISDEDSVFPMAWFEGGTDERTGVIYRGCFDPVIRLGQGPFGKGKKDWLQLCVMGVDPAIADTDRSSYFALVVLGLDYQGRIIIADMLRDRYNFVTQKRVVVEMYKKWNPRYVVVESNVYQKALLEGITEDYPNIPVYPYYTTRKLPPDVGVPAMDIYFESGRVRIPRADFHSRDMTDLLVDELHYWGKHGSSDLVMALWFAFQRMMPEIERTGVMPPVRDLIFGDRIRFENQSIMGLSGKAVPRKTADRIRQMAITAPLAHLRKHPHPIIRQLLPQEEVMR